MRQFIDTALFVFSMLWAANLAAQNTQQVFFDPSCTSPELEAECPVPIDIVLADFDNDTNMDMAVVSDVHPEAVSVLLGDGSGNFTFKGLFTVGYRPLRISVEDFNEDHNKDIVTSNQDGSISILYGDGTGNLGMRTDLAVGNIPYEIRAVDINNDLHVDLVITLYYQDSIAVLLGNGTGGFGVPSIFVAGGVNPGDLAIGDFNADGKPDVAVTFYSSSPKVLFGDGNGNFGAPNDLGTIGSRHAIVSGDINHDNRADLIATSSDTISVFLGTATGLGVPTEIAMAGGDPGEARLEDFNGDGKLDLALTNGSGITIFTGDGAGHLILLGSFPAIPGMGTLAVGDLNKDGLAEVVVSDLVPNPSVTILTNICNCVAATPTGSDVTSTVGNLTFTFSEVTAAGSTIVKNIDPATIGDVSGGFAVSQSVAVQIISTATFSGPVTIAIVVPQEISKADFDLLSVLHNENGSLVDVTASYPVRDYPSRTIYATTASFSPFYVIWKGLHVSPLFDQTKSYKGGSTVPIKLKMLNASGFNVSANNLVVTARSLNRIGENTASPLAYSGNSNPDSNFRYDPMLGGYIFNLSTKGLAPGKYLLSLYAGSGYLFFYTVTFEIK